MSSLRNEKLSSIGEEASRAGPASMNNDLLQAWVEQISLAFFEQPFRHQATFNQRLRSTGGRYFTKSHNIEISWKHYEKFGAHEVERIIKHELCHYHLHLAGLGYQHRDAAFKQLLVQVGGTRFCQSLGEERKPEPDRYKLVCKSCGQIYLRKRRVDPRKYGCGRCRGALKLVMLDLPAES